MMNNRKKILLVDDDRDFLKSNRILLEACGYEIDTAENGKEAMKRLSISKPDLVILDVMMTYDTEGLDTAREVRSLNEYSDVKILMVSGISDKKNLKNMPRPDKNWLPVERVLEKPIGPDQLINEIEKLLGR